MNPLLEPREPMFHEASIVKQNKRLMIVDKQQRIVYCPPTFLRPVNSRKDFLPLLISYQRNGFIEDSILTDFETRYNPRLHK